MRSNLRIAAHATSLALLAAWPSLGGQDPLPHLAPGSPGLAGPGLEPFRAVYSQSVDGRVAGRRELSLTPELDPSGVAWHYVIAIETGVTVRDEIVFSKQGLTPLRRLVHVPGRSHRLEVWTAPEHATAATILADGSLSEEAVETEGARLPASMLDLITAHREGGGFRASVYTSDFGPAGNLLVEVEIGAPTSLELAGRTWEVRPVIETILKPDGSRLGGPDGSPFPRFSKWLSSQPPYLIRAHYGPLEVQLERWSPLLAREGSR